MNQEPGMKPNDLAGETDVVGEVRITLTRDLATRLEVTGLFQSPHFLEQAAGYLRAYTDQEWRRVFETGETKQGELNRR